MLGMEEKPGKMAMEGEMDRGGGGESLTRGDKDKGRGDGAVQRQQQQQQGQQQHQFAPPAPASFTTPPAAYPPVGESQPEADQINVNMGRKLISPMVPTGPAPTARTGSHSPFLVSFGRRRMDCLRRIHEHERRGRSGGSKVRGQGIRKMRDIDHCGQTGTDLGRMRKVTEDMAERGEAQRG